MGKRELVALLNLSPWCLVMVEWLFLAVPSSCLLFVIVVFPDHTPLLLFAHPIGISVIFTHVVPALEQSVPRDNRLSSLGKPHDANW